MLLAPGLDQITAQLGVLKSGKVCVPLVRAGASLLAIIGGVWGHPDGPAAGVRAINAAIKTALS